MIIDHDHPGYRFRWRNSGENRYNGAFYYSKEIVKYMIPRVRTSRNWVTVNIKSVAANHSIVFIHNNMHPENYNWLKRYKDLVLVCGVPETVDKVRELGTPIYLPLSVNLKDLETYQGVEKTRGCAFAGRRAKMQAAAFPPNCDVLAGLPRQQLLEKMTKYRKIYAVGRTAIEAKALGCEIGVYDPRFPDPDLWQVLDIRDAAKILQERLDEIDGNYNRDKED